MPSLQRARNQARSVVCQSNLKQWGTIFASYTDDNHGRFFDDVYWHSWYLFRYIKNTPQKKSFPHLCPMAVKTTNQQYIGSHLIDVYEIGSPFILFFGVDIGILLLKPGITKTSMIQPHIRAAME